MLDSQIAILLQAKNYLHSTSSAQYTQVLKPYFISSAGEHIRHIIDHYQAIITGISNNIIDYDLRSRGNQVESDPLKAIEKITQIIEWIEQLDQLDLNKLMPLSTEISVNEQQVQVVQTSIAREIIFAGSHAIHHYALIAQIAHHQNLTLPADFGIAPTTASFLRDQNAS